MSALKAGARSSILRVTTCKAPRAFERLLIKERHKPRFIKAGARSSILRVTTCKAPRTKKKVRVSPKGWRTVFDSSSAKIHNFHDNAKEIAEKTPSPLA